MPDTDQEVGRINQKRRTRAAIVAAARHLLQQGQIPSIQRVADAALVSRATAYRYFPTQDLLLFEATLESAAVDIGQRLAAAPPSDDPATRLDTVVQVLQRVTLDNEVAFRTLLRLSLEAPAGDEANCDTAETRLRGGRRLDWIAEAVAPRRAELDRHPQAFRRLAAALSLCMGIEAVIVLRDICGLEPDAAVEVSRWAAQALLAAGLSEGDAEHVLPEG
jgi:AcrR family transcriptional regulator